jgi:hypothetical protein
VTDQVLVVSVSLGFCANEYSDYLVAERSIKLILANYNSLKLTNAAGFDGAMMLGLDIGGDF